MDIVIERFYNTINIDYKGKFNDEFNFDDVIPSIDLKRSEILKRIIESGVNIKEIESISNLDEEEIKYLLNL